MNLLQKCLVALAIANPFHLSGQEATSDTVAGQLMEQTWREFRDIHPFGYQTVGLKHRGDTCVFVMSEPAHWVKEETLRKLFEKYHGQMALKHQPFGIDGQLTDAVGCVRLDSGQFRKFEQEAFQLLYRTSYKPYYTDLDHPAPHVYFSPVSLNLSCPLDSILCQRFLVKGPDGSTGSRSFAYPMLGKMAQSNEIYYSERRGMIVWVFDTDKDILADDSFLVNARKFALDSDLILATFCLKGRMAIVGREREVPVHILPPLRSETILTLAAVQEPPFLFFDRDSLTTVNDTTVATPIQMSPQLENTEMGNLMVLTDWFLKSWSENGSVKEYTLDYPRPQQVLFPKGVAHELGDSTLYLWQTEFVESGALGFYPVIQTGSLPTCYWSASDTLLSKQSVMSHAAYCYFADLNNPELVRTAMYMSIAHIFQKAGVSTSAEHGASWVQTPSWIITDAPLGYGGFPIKLFKGLGKMGKATGKGIAGKAIPGWRGICGGGHTMSQKVPESSLRWGYVPRVSGKFSKLDQRLTNETERFTPEIKASENFHVHLRNELQENPFCGTSPLSPHWLSVFPPTETPIRPFVPAASEERGFQAATQAAPTPHEPEDAARPMPANKREQMILEMRRQIVKHQIPLKAFKAEIQETDFGFILILFDNDYPTFCNDYPTYLYGEYEDTLSHFPAPDQGV